MSLISTTAAAAASPTLNLISHGHKKGGHGVKDGDASSSAQSPATTQSLLSSLFESIEQVLGISVSAPQTASTAAPTTAATAAGAVTAATGATATAAGASAAAISPTTTPGATVAASAAAGSAQDVQGFLHSLIQALKADGAGAGAGATANAGGGAAAGAGPVAVVGTAAPSVAGRYDGSFISSLQTLIHQVDSNGPTTAATSNLNASFNALIQGAAGSAAGAGASSSGAGPSGSGAASQVSLQSFLSSLLQNVQSGGIHSFSPMGANVNAKV